MPFWSQKTSPRFREWIEIWRRRSVKRVLWEISQNSQENTYLRISALIKLQAQAWNFIKKETLAQVFSCEFCEISKNIFSYKTPLVAASGYAWGGYFARNSLSDWLNVKRHSSVMRCTIWYQLYNFKIVKNIHERVLLLVKLQTKSLQLYQQ